MNIDLKRKNAVTFGLRASGKSTFVNKVTEDHGARALLYDTLHEAPKDAPYYSYKPKNRNSVAELEAVILKLKDSRQFDLFVIDECNRFAPSKPTPLPPQLADLNDQSRHYGLSVIYIARRPCQLNQDLTELADYMFIFALTGKSDIKYLNDISGGLGDTVLQLQQYQFVVVNPNRSYFIANPITPSEKWLSSAKQHLTNFNAGVSI
jgi:hypothetical protein